MPGSFSPSPVLRKILPVLLVLSSAGCASLLPHDVAPETPGDTSLGSAVSTAVSVRSTSEAQARTDYAQAAAVSQQTTALVGSWAGADALLERSRAALVVGDWSAAQRASEEALAAADQVLSDHYARLANRELAKTYAFAGLDDTQLLQLRAAEEIMVTGNSRLAYGRLRMLNDQLEKRVRSYTVQAGDSLWVIAARPEVYANGLLWPLVWQNNAVQIPDPNRLRRGQVLKLKSHPSADEIAEAVSYARGERKRQRGVTPQIGEIREARER